MRTDLSDHHHSFVMCISRSALSSGDKVGPALQINQAINYIVKAFSAVSQSGIVTMHDK